MIPSVRHRLYGFVCHHCNGDCAEAYMLKSHVWEKAIRASEGKGRHAAFNRQLLHLACVETLIGRELTLDDLTDAPINAAARFFAGKGK